MNYKEMFEASLKAEGITGSKAAFARSINHQESGGGANTKTSNAGAEGGMQIIPGTFASVADKGWDIKNPEHNARAGIRYAMQMFDKAGGDPAVAAAGYYGGPGGMEKARRGIAVSDPRNPNAPTTLQYGQQVAARMGKGVPVAQAVPVEQPMAGGVPVVTKAPQMVQVPVAEQVAQAPVVEQAAPWQEFQQAMPVPKVQVADFNYGAPQGAASMVDPYAVAALPTKTLQPNFGMFKAFRGRA